MNHPFDQTGIARLFFFPDSGQLQAADTALPGVPAFSIQHLDDLTETVTGTDRPLFACVMRAYQTHLVRYHPEAESEEGEWVLDAGFRLETANDQELHVQMLVFIAWDTSSKKGVWTLFFRKLPSLTHPGFWAIPKGKGTSLTQQLERCFSNKELARFTPSELAVIRLLCMGFGPKEISSKINIKEQTARTHIRNARKKVGVPNVAGLVHIARQSGLVD